MAQLYDAVEKIDAEIQRRGLDAARVKGEIGFAAGFFLAIIFPATPDDADKLARLRAASKQVLGVDVLS